MTSLSRSEYGRVRVKPLAGAIGAEIEGVDLRALSSAVVGEVEHALHRYLVVFFRDQPLTRPQLVAAGRAFGTLNVDLFVRGPEGAPEVMEIVKEAADRKRNFGGGWHTDVSFLEQPSLGSLLHAIEVPEVGGDTMFGNMYLAYEALSPGMRRLLEGLRAVHCAHPAYNREQMDAGNAAAGGIKYTDADPRAYSAVHPVVRTHPRTGRRALYVNSSYTRRFEDMSEEESRPLLQFLFAHLGRPEFTCRFRWRNDSVAFWDNRCTQHFPINDYHGHRRHMQRVTLAGDRPFLAA